MRKRLRKKLGVGEFRDILGPSRPGGQATSAAEMIKRMEKAGATAVDCATAYALVATAAHGMLEAYRALPIQAGLSADDLL